MRWADQQDDEDQDVEVKLRYYTQKEYKRLSDAQKRKLKRLREERDVKGNRNGTDKRQRTNSIASIQSQVKAIGKQVSAIAKQIQLPSDADKHNTTESMKDLTNHKHPALQRPKK